MNGLHRPSRSLLRVLLMGISGSRSQTIDDTLYRNGRIPVRPASSCKCYRYRVRNGERKTAAVRDIMVEDT